MARQIPQAVRRPGCPPAPGKPHVRFPVTLCVVCYGAHAALARRFLTSLYRHTDPALFELRAGLNEVEPATREAFRRHADRFGNIEVWLAPRNRFKNPMMRTLFQGRPLASPWTLWCDDDTHFVRSDWLERLADRIASAPEVALWGQLWTVAYPDPGVETWIRQAPWYTGLPLKRMPDGDDPGVPGWTRPQFLFATGGFWAARTAMLKALDWPDRRLIQAGEDCLLGEAMRQNRLRLGHHDYGVRVNDAPRRNASAPEVTRLHPHSRSSPWFRGPPSAASLPGGVIPVGR